MSVDMTSSSMQEYNASIYRACRSRVSEVKRSVWCHGVSGTARVVVRRTSYKCSEGGWEGGGNASEVHRPKVLMVYVMSTVLANLNRGLWS